MIPPDFSFNPPQLQVNAREQWLDGGRGGEMICALEAFATVGLRLPAASTGGKINSFLVDMKR